MKRKGILMNKVIEHFANILLTIFMVVTLLLTGCEEKRINTSPSSLTSETEISTSVIFPSGTDLDFNLVGEFGDIGGAYNEKSGQIIVIANKTDSFLPNTDWVKPEHKNTILEIDYSQYFVILAFNGWRGGIGNPSFNIKRIWQKDNNIYVLAHFDDFIPGATSVPLYNSQYQAAKINRIDIIQTGEITFKLLDESGKERASTIEKFSRSEK